MWSIALSVFLVAYLPGAVVFRLPLAQRERRANLSAEERVFWCIAISLAVSSAVAFILATIGLYRFDRLLLTNGLVSLALAMGSRGDLWLHAVARRPSLSALAPASLVVLAGAVFFSAPPAEYVLGGRDPGVYLIEGVQIAQTGSLVVRDPMVETLPPEFRSMFIQQRQRFSHYGTRFMAFFVTDPDNGLVVGQFPHLYPVWVAIGYGLNGLLGARQIIAVLAILGIVAVYFCGAWLLGRPAALVGAVLLTLNVAQVWHSRYPNAEILTQLLVFMAILAFSRATVDENRFFAPLAASFLALSMLAHFSAILVVGAIGLTVVLGTIDSRRLQALFLIPLTIGLGLVAWYYGTILSDYLGRPTEILTRAGPNQILLMWIGLAVLCAVLWFTWRGRHRGTIHAWLPWAVAGTLTVLVAYAYFFRMPVFGLAPHDAGAVRDFAAVYISPVGLLTALLGLWVLVRRAFWPGLTFIISLTVFSCFVFYKIRIVPEHFWLARRFLPVILPSVCLLIGYAVCLPTSVRLPAWLDRRGVRGGLFALGAVLLLLLAGRSVAATRPIINYVEYAGVIPHLETLADQFDDSDLVLIETRYASDLHTLAVPLAYIYGRQVLLLTAREPDPETLRNFLAWAQSRYQRVVFVGSGGSQLLSRSTTAVPLTLEQFQVPEYERSYPAPPREIRYKDFTFGIYELLPRSVTQATVEIDVGHLDDLFVRQFYNKETAGPDTTFRWTRKRSLVFLPALSDEVRRVTLWLGAGSRPAHITGATVEVHLNEVLLGSVTPVNSFEPYHFEIPLVLASEIGTSEEAAVLRLESTTWSPRAALGEADSRDLGVMVDRITVN